MNYPRNFNKHKIIFIGDSGVGKTSILNNYSKKNYTPKATLGTEFTEKYIEKHNLTLQIWDCAGQERFRALTKLYYRGAHICVFVFDLSNKTSLESIENYWIPTVKNNAGESVQFILVGNKLDLTTSIDYSIVWNLCKTYNMKFIETSVIQNIHIQNIFEIACLLIISQKTDHLEKKQENKIYKNIENSENKQNKNEDKKISLITPITLPEQIYNIYTQC
jgi:small GTP-binding protein